MVGANQPRRITATGFAAGHIDYIFNSEAQSSEALPLGKISNALTKALFSLTVVVELFIPANDASWALRARSSRNDG